MQTTKINLYSLKVLCQQAGQHFTGAGYTTRPGFSDGLLLSNRVPPMSGYKGFRCSCQKGG